MLDEILPEAFAVVREAAKRTIGSRHYDVQLIGGAVLHRGQIAEMRTGEGKTLVATLPIYLNALTGRASIWSRSMITWPAVMHAGWRPSFIFLGLTVGVLQMAAATENGKKAFIVDFSNASRRMKTSITCAWSTAWKPTPPISPTAPTRVRLRLSARQHDHAPGRPCPARPLLRHRG